MDKIMDNQIDCEVCERIPYISYFCNMWTFLVKGSIFVKYGIQLWCYSIFQSEVPIPDNQIKAWITTYTD